MDVLKVGTKDYIKASVIARELGYTTDYVGQLCRSNKIDAKLFGRSWYVERDSIQEHKSNRYRATTVKSIKAIREEAEESSEVPIHATQEKRPIAQQRFYIHNFLKAEPRYTPDEAELIPEVGQAQKKQGNLKLELADSVPVKIASFSEDYTFQTPEMPEIKFKGKLSVTEAEAVIDVPPGGLLLHAREVNHLKSEKKTKNKVISSKPELNTHNKSLKVVPVDLDPQIVTEVITESVQIEDEGGYRSAMIVFSSTVLSISCLILLLGLEIQLSATESTFVSEYNFRIEPLLASVYGAFL